MTAIDVDKLNSVHYRTLSKVCMYCPKRPKAVRVTVMESGALLIAALCTHHAAGEMESETKGMRNPEGTSDFYTVEGS